MEEYATKTTRQKYGKSEVYAKFKHGIFVRTDLSCVPELYSFTYIQEVQHPDTAIPPISEFIPRGMDDL
jgi:hypothetical protein